MAASHNVLHKLKANLVMDEFKSRALTDVQMMCTSLIASHPSFIKAQTHLLFPSIVDIAGSQLFFIGTQVQPFYMG